MQLIALFLWPYFWGVVLPYVEADRMGSDVSENIRATGKAVWYRLLERGGQ